MSDFIHELIGTLSQTEKRYFKLYSNFSSDNDSKGYIQLFELIEKQREYDEEKIKKVYGDKHFAQKKKHLIVKILEALRSYHQKGSLNNEIDNEIQESKQLINRAFYNQALKTLKRAEIKANEADIVVQYLRIKQAETDLLRAEGNPQKLEEHLIELQKELPEILNRFEIKLKIEKLFINFVKINQVLEFVRNSKQQKQLDELMRDDVLKLCPDDLSSSTLINYHYIHALFNYMIGDFEKSFDHFFKQLTVFDNHKILINEYSSEYARCVSNTAYLAVKCKSKNALTFILNLEKLSNLRNVNDDILYYWNYFIKLNHFVNTEKHEEAWAWYLKNQKIISALESNETSSINISERNYALFDSSLAGLILGKYKEVKRNLNNYLNNNEYALKPEAIITARFIIVHIDLFHNQYPVNDGEIKSLTRYCTEKEICFGFEKANFQFLKEFDKAQTLKEKKQLFEKFKQQLKKLKDNKLDRNAFAMFDFEYWLAQIELKA